MPRFLALEREHRSLILGLRAGAAPPGRRGRERRALEPLRDAGRRDGGAGGRRWRARLPAGAVRLGARRSTAVAATRAGLAGEARTAGPRLTADGVVLAGQAPRMAPLVRDARSRPGRLARRDRVRVVGDRGARLSAGGDPPPARRLRLRGARGSRAGRVLACTFSSVKYPGRAPEGSSCCGCSSAGRSRRELLAHDDAGLARLAHGDWRRCWGSTATPSCPACGGTRPPCPSTRWATWTASRRSRRAWRPARAGPGGRRLPGGGDRRLRPLGGGRRRAAYLETQRTAAMSDPPDGPPRAGARAPLARTRARGRRPQSDVRRPGRPGLDGDRVGPEEPRLEDRRVRPGGGVDPDRLPGRGLQGIRRIRQGDASQAADRRSRPPGRAGRPSRSSGSSTPRSASSG